MKQNTIKEEALRQEPATTGSHRLPEAFQVSELDQRMLTALEAAAERRPSK